MHASAGKLILESPNDEDLTLAELESLADELRSSLGGDNGVTVEVRGRQVFGAGTAFSDVVNVILPDAEFIQTSVYTLVLERIVTFCRRRFARPHERRRRRVIRVYDSGGKLQRSYVITDESAEPKLADETEQFGERVHE